MSEGNSILGPNDEGKEVSPGDEVVLPASDYPGQEKTVFRVTESPNHEDMVVLEEQVEDERSTRAKAYFRKGKKLTYNLMPDHIKGEEGRRFLKIAGALAATAVAGAASAYIIIRRRSKGQE